MPAFLRLSPLGYSQSRQFEKWAPGTFGVRFRYRLVEIEAVAALAGSVIFPSGAASIDRK
jgi:hypothetical protein